MLTPIGQMREPAVILTPVRTTDSSGGEIITYVEGAPIFVSLRSLGTREANELGQVNADISHVCYGHWVDLGTISAKQRLRVLETSQTFDINGGPLNDPKRAYTRLNLIERENG